MLIPHVTHTIQSHTLMSSSSAEGYLAAAKGPPLLGGFPTHIDLAPSIIFVVVHVFLFSRFAQQAISLRMKHKRFHFPSIRLLPYGVIRIVTFILRAVLSETTAPSIALIITASVFLTTGLIFLVFPCITLSREILLKTHPDLANQVDSKGKPTGILKAPYYLQRLLIIALILSVTGASLGTSDAGTSKTLREVSNFVLLAILGLHIISLFYMQRRYGLQAGPLALLALATLLALVVVVYKTIQIYSTSYITTINTPAVFYDVFALPEVLCALCFAIPNVAKVYSGIGDEKNSQLDMEARPQQQVQTGNHPPYPQFNQSYPPPQYQGK